MNPFFTDIMNASEISWGTEPLMVRTYTRTMEDGYPTTATFVDTPYDKVSSPQLLDPQEVSNKGFGQYATGEVYECFSLVEIPLNDSPLEYRTILYNQREYEIIKCSPFGVNRGGNFDGYYDIYFGRKANSQGGFGNADQ